MRVHQLRHVLVAGRDQRVDALFGRLLRQGPDHVIGLDAVDDQQRQAHGADDVERRFDLHTQLFGHRRAVGLVFRIQRVAEGLARGIEHHRDVRGLIVGDQLAQHVDHTDGGAGRLALRVGQWRQRVEGPKQVGRAVDQDERGSICHRRRILRPRAAAVRSPRDLSARRVRQTQCGALRPSPASSPDSIQAPKPSASACGSTASSASGASPTSPSTSSPASAALAV